MLGHSVIHVSARILTCLVFLGTQQVKRYVQGGQGTFFEATEFEGGFVAFFDSFLVLVWYERGVAIGVNGFIHVSLMFIIVSLHFAGYSCFTRDGAVIFQMVV